MTFIHLEQQFVVNLQDGANVRTGRQLCDQLLHCELQNLCCGALDGSVHAAALCEAALAPVGTIIDVGKVSASAEGGFRVSIQPRPADRGLLPFCQRGIACLQVCDDCLAVRYRLIQSRLEFQRLLQSSGEQSVECTEVHILCNRAALLIVGIVFIYRLTDRDVEDDRCGLGVDVAATAICFHHLFIPTVECTYAQFDL